MTPEEFDLFWREPKCVNDDVVYSPVKDLPHWLEFERLVVLGSSREDICVGGTFNCRTGQITFSFSIQGKAQVCRYDVNGAVHKNEGRTHKHFIKSPRCVSRQLPHAVRRDDLIGLTAPEVWVILCKEASLEHPRDFFDPKGHC